MKLGVKLLWIAGPFMIVLALLFHVAASRIVLHGFQDIERDRSGLNVDRVFRAIERRENQLLSSVMDWSKWDSTYEFIQDQNTAFIRDNLTVAAFQDLGINAMILANEAGEIVWGGVLNTGATKISAPPADLLHLFESKATDTWFSSEQDGPYGILCIKDGPMIVAAHAILTSEGTGPSRGTLLMGYYLDTNVVSELADDLRMDISFSALNAPMEHAGVAQAMSDLMRGTPYVIQPISEDELIGYGLVHDINGQPVLLLHVHMPRDIYHHGLRTYRFFAMLLLGGGTLFTFFLIYLQRRLVLAPLAKLGVQVNRVSLGSDDPPRVSLPGAADELASLANHINLMMQRERDTQHTLSESRQQYEWLFREMISGFAMHELICNERGEPTDYRFLAINPAFERLTGLRADEVVGRTVREVLPGTEARWIETYGRVVQTGEPIFFEDYSQALGKYFEVNAFRNAPGQFAVMFSDITERKRAENKIRELLDDSNRSKQILLSILEDEKKAQEALLESKASYRDLFENMLSGYSYCRMVYEDGKPVDFVYLSVNPAFTKITGLRDVVGRRISEVIPDIRTSNPEMLAIYGRVAESGQPEAFETLIAELGIWVSNVVHSPRKGEFVAVFNDITSRKQAEAALRLQSAALEAAANAIVITDHKGVVQWVNSAFAASSGYSKQEAIGKSPGALIRSDQHDTQFYQTLNLAIQRGEVWSGEIVNRRKDGQLYTEEMTITPVRGDNGIITHFVAIKQDITERKRLEAQLLRTQRLESVGRLASGIAHDLNNILTPVLLAPPILREAVQDPVALSIVDSIETSARRGAAIIKQLLTFGRGSPSQRAPLSMRSLVRDMMKIVEETFPKNIRVRSDLSAGIALVHGDATQLHQVLMNLCVNARDAMPNGGTLTFSLHPVDVNETVAQANPGARPGSYIQLTVSDTGEGIPPEHMDKIFDPFFTTKPVGEGTGLGLSTVLSIVRDHEGFIQIESRSGEGATFRVLLPTADMPHETAHEEIPAPVPHGNGEVVLVVDDEEHVRNVTCRVLNRNGYRCLNVSSGADALSALEKQDGAIRAMITDLMMPGMDGVALIREVRSHHANLPIIAISGNLMKSDQLQTVNAIVQIFLSKPCSSADLLRALQQVLHPV